MMSTLKAALKLVLLLLWIALWYLPVWLAKKWGKITSRDAMVRWCYCGILLIVGIRLKVTGSAEKIRPLLLVTNHLSYLDIFVLGSAAPVRFAPKSEIAAWPVIGGICRMCDAVFVDRRPEKIKETAANMQAALGRDELVCLFPEGTTGNGLHMLPFKSGFFSLAEEKITGRELTIQPAAISYTRIRRLPIDTTQWPLIAWYGDMELLPHLWRLLKIGSIDAELVFLPPVTKQHYGDRKQIAAHCHHAIAEAARR
jgi:1-acyl-sn-glycerol-3-phosphate acyltransferase